MAQAPGGAKGGGKSPAPAQFDMNKRDGKFSGKGKPGGRGRDEPAKAPSRIESMTPVVVDRGQGFVIRKVARVDHTTRTQVSAEYFLDFEGHDPMKFDYLKAARDRAKEPPPEKEVAPEPEALTDTAPGLDAASEEPVAEAVPAAA